MKALVVPTIREKSINEFLYHWQPDHYFDIVIVVEDNPTKKFKLNVDHHVCWQDIDVNLDKDAWMISRRDSAIRSYGFLLAYKFGADYIFTLDDDCHPIDSPSSFIEGHISAMNDTPRWSEAILGMRTRGMPYDNLGKLDNVMLNMGLWTNVPDYDSIQMFTVGAAGLSGFTPPPGNRIIPSGQYFPLCGMNLAFKREFAPLAYFLLMGQNQPYSRFDDIWFGIISKKICDHLGWFMSVGEPFVEHQRASDKFANLTKESPGLKTNESFWETVDDIQLSGSNPIECMLEISSGLKKSSQYYIAKLGRAIKIWCGLF